MEYNSEFPLCSSVLQARRGGPSVVKAFDFAFGFGLSQGPRAKKPRAGVLQHDQMEGAHLLHDFPLFSAG